MPIKKCTLLLALSIVSFLSYHLGFITGITYFNNKVCCVENVPSKRLALSGFLTNDANVTMASPRSSLGIYKNSADHRCRVISYDRLPEDSCTWVRLKINNTPFICVYSASEDRFVSHYIKTTGTWDAGLINMIVALLRTDPDFTFIDIGSNIGQFSLVAASMGNNVIAVDALKRHALMLGRAVVMNHYQNLVKIIHNALSDSYHNVSLVTFEGNPGMTRVKTARNAFKPVAEKVPTILMDDLVHFVDSRRAIMKIDIEGQEVAALSHSIQLFTLVDIPVIMMEWWGGEENLYTTKVEKAKVITLISFFKSRGYRVYDKDWNILDINDWRSWPFDIIWKKTTFWMKLRLIKYQRIVPYLCSSRAVCNQTKIKTATLGQMVSLQSNHIHYKV